MVTLLHRYDGAVWALATFLSPRNRTLATLSLRANVWRYSYNNAYIYWIATGARHPRNDRGVHTGGPLLLSPRGWTTGPRLWWLFLYPPGFRGQAPE